MRSTRTRDARLAIAVSMLVVGTGESHRASHVAAAESLAPAVRTAADRVAHGEYLVRTGGCHDCHTPWKAGENGPEPDMSRMLMGHPANVEFRQPAGMKAPWIGASSPTMTAWIGPWGRSHAANLTPDADTGLGRWTEQQFIDTMRTGRRHGTGRPLLPPMPWSAFGNLADEDLAAMFAYLRTIPAIANAVPAPSATTGPEPPMPRRIEAPVSAPGDADPVARGRYLVAGKGCGDCHTPMTMGQNGPQADRSRFLSGFDGRGQVPPMPSVDGVGELFGAAPVFAGAWGISFAANITPDPDTGIGNWTEQQFVDTLRNGRHQGRGRQLLPPMPWQVFGEMTDADLKAIFAYLKTVTPVRNAVPEPVPAAR